MWTRFYDLHSGGLPKTKWAVIWVELPEDEAVEWFKKRFDRDPNNVTCTCCGGDFSISCWTSWDELDDLATSSITCLLVNAEAAKKDMTP